MAETVGERIAQARRLLAVKLKRDVTQGEIAEMAGFSSAVWSRWETDRNRPGRNALGRIERLFRKHGIAQVTVGWLDYGDKPLDMDRRASLSGAGEL